MAEDKQNNDISLTMKHHKKKFTIALALLLLCSINSNAQQLLDSKKMSSYLRNLARENVDMKARGMQANKRSVCALLKLGDGVDAHSITAEYGCTLQDSISRIYIVNIPLDQLGRLSGDNRVVRIEAHEMPSPNMDKVPTRTGAVEAWKGEGLPQAFTGEGVIAGVMDIGFDFTHPMFSDKGGNLRISRFYDMATVDNDGLWGKTYEAEDIIGMQHSTRGGIQYHGTHVASLMAGTAVEGTAGVYSGMSPESNIVLLELGGSSIEEGDDGMSSNDAQLILGIKHLFDYADEIGLPCVVNISLGAWIPISESTELIDEAITNLLGPGHVVVSSAGNNGGTPATMTKREGVPEIRAAFYGNHLFSDTTSTWYKAKSIECDLVTEGPQELRFHFGANWGDDWGTTHSLKTDSIDMRNGETFYVEEGLWRDSDYNCDDTLKIDAYKIMNPPSYVNGNLYHISLTVKNMTLDPLHVWIGWFGFETSVIGDGPCWMFTNPTLTPFTTSAMATKDESQKYECVDYSYTTGWPASITNVIAVGSLSTNVSHGWGEGKYISDAERSPFSSCGPNWRQQTKPNVMAPGINICGAYNNYCNSFENDKKLFRDVVEGADGAKHYIISTTGTSMSSPIVAGAIALWLQAKPDLTPEEIMEVLSKTCKHPDGAGESVFPNNMYGYGEIDVYAGLLHILGITNKIDNISAHQPTAVRVKVDGRTLTLIDTTTGMPYNGKVSWVVYSTDGKRIASANANAITLPSLYKGVYAVQISTDDEAATGSTLIRI